MMDGGQRYWKPASQRRLCRRWALTLRQKMAQVAKGASPVRLSTHPSGEDRMKRTKGALKDVMPLYGKMCPR